MKPLLTLVLACVPVAAAHAATCFTLFDRANTVVYRSAKPPIDLSAPISDGLARAYPGMHLLWTNDLAACQELDARPAAGRGDEAAKGKSADGVALPSRLGAPIIPLRDSVPASGSMQAPYGQPERRIELPPMPRDPRPRVSRGLAGRR